MTSLLKKLEWSSYRRGQGSGYMSSGGDGPLFPACPICKQLKEPNGHFMPGAVGHKPDCELKKALEWDIAQQIEDDWGEIFDSDEPMNGGDCCDYLCMLIERIRS